MVNLTNQWRESQKMPPLAQINVPNFGLYNVLEENGTRVLRNLLVEDAVRGYNGFVPESRTNPARQTGQFGLPWHEFWLKTTRVDIPKVGTNQEVLVVENERRDAQGRLVADAIWARIPSGSRPPVGDPNYVENVRGRLPTCP